MVLRYSTGEKCGERKGARLGSVIEDAPETVIEGEVMKIRGKICKLGNRLRQ